MQMESVGESGASSVLSHLPMAFFVFRKQLTAEWTAEENQSDSVKRTYLSKRPYGEKIVGERQIALAYVPRAVRMKESEEDR